MSGDTHRQESRPGCPSWLCRDDFDRERMLDMEGRVRPVRQRALAILAVALIAAGPWLGWWPALFLIPAALCFGVADVLMPRVGRPELLMFGAGIGSGLVIGGAVALSGGPSQPTLAWLAIPVITLSSRFPMRGVVVGVIINIVILLAVAFGVDAQQIIHDPVLVIAPVALLLCVAVLSTPLMRSDIQHRSDAVIDQLTGMLNRKALSTRVAELAQQSQLTGESIGIIVGDLDHFKAINDTRGHSVGDVVLKEVAYQLRKQLRAFDLAYRLGGEEFLILLPGSDLEQSAHLAEQLRRGVAGEGVAGGLDVTMSFGVGASTRGEPFDYAEVFKAADAALYRAKRSGRDRVCVSDDEATATPALGEPVFA
jgi:diguanylate cyclase (GGDEF)-like protein